MLPIRFHQDGQITRCEGLLNLQGDRLRLEYEWTDKMFGLWKSGIKEASIPVSALVSAELARGWFGCTRIILQAASMEAMRDAPGMSQGRVVLHIPREDREAARNLVDGLCKPSTARSPGLYD